jgi:hypothetical protein
MVLPSFEVSVVNGKGNFAPQDKDKTTVWKYGDSSPHSVASHAWKLET